MSEYTQFSLFDPIRIPLTDKGFTIIDTIDADLTRFSWCLCDKYARARIFGKKMLLHRVILERKLGRPLLDNEQCDHINRNHLDNRRDNLRVCSRDENARNRKPSRLSKTGLKGVVYPDRSHGFRAQIMYQKKRYWLGSFDTAEEAHQAYLEAAKRLFGEFANLE